MSSIIFEKQKAFIKDRSILECSMMGSEVIHILSARREKAVLLKLNFQKAFDCLSWDFLFATMNRMGFNQTWINWMNKYLSIARVSILMNESSLVPFNMNHGVRQGDTLSPFLFIIIVEELKCMLDKAREGGLIDGIFILESLPELSLL